MHQLQVSISDAADMRVLRPLCMLPIYYGHALHFCCAYHALQPCCDQSLQQRLLPAAAGSGRSGLGCYLLSICPVTDAF